MISKISVDFKAVYGVCVYCVTVSTLVVVKLDFGVCIRGF